MALREILVELGIEVDDNGAERAIEGIRSGLRRMANQERTSRQGLRNFGNTLGSIRNVALGFGAAFLTGKVAQGFGSLITQAGDAAEVANKFGAVFNEEAQGVGESLDKMAKATGQSKTAIKEMAADAGALVKPLVGSDKAAGELAKTMTSAALDIASFENRLPKEALGAIRSALIGSSEPMLAFGVDTRQAALAQFALDQGIGKSIKSMKSSEVTALRMELIMKRLGDKGALGDAAATAGSFTNRLKALQGVMADGAAEIGAEFLPAARKLLGVLIPMARDVIPTLVQGAKGLVSVFKFLGNVVSGLLIPFKQLDTALWSLGYITLTGLAVAFKSVGVAATLAGLKTAAVWLLTLIPFLIIAAAIALIIEDFVKMGEGGESVSGTLIQGFNDLVDELGSIPEAIWEMLKTALAYWMQFFGSTQEEANEFVSVLDATLRNFFPDLIDGWTKDFAKFFKMIMGGFAEATEAFLDYSTLGGLSAVKERIANVAASFSSPASVPQVAGAGGGTNVNNASSSVNIKVDASSASSPEDVGRAVASQVEIVMGKQNRDLLQRFSVVAP